MPFDDMPSPIPNLNYETDDARKNIGKSLELAQTMENTDVLVSNRYVIQPLIRSTNNLKICQCVPEDVPNGILKPETYYKTKRNILATSVENDTKNVKYKSILKYNFVKPKPEREYYSNDNYQASKVKMQSNFINDVVH